MLCINYLGLPEPTLENGGWFDTAFVDYASPSLYLLVSHFQRLSVRCPSPRDAAAADGVTLPRGVDTLRPPDPVGEVPLPGVRMPPCRVSAEPAELTSF